MFTTSRKPKDLALETETPKQYHESLQELWQISRVKDAMAYMHSHAKQYRLAVKEPETIKTLIETQASNDIVTANVPPDAASRSSRAPTYTSQAFVHKEKQRETERERERERETYK